MWLQDGQRSRCVLDASPPAGSPETGSANGSQTPSSQIYVSGQSCWPGSWWKPSAASRQPRPAEVRRGSRGERSWLHRLSLMCLCLLMLPSCSMLSPKPPTATPVATRPEPLQCLDRLLLPCPGVDDVTPMTCADAVVLAVDGLTGLAACQDRHAELVLCVREYQGRNKQ